MALNLATQYPGKVGAPTAAYPNGVPRNVSAPSAGDGTPWEEALVKDVYGFLAAALGGITPSGSPDSFTASQYMQGITNSIQNARFRTAAGTNTVTLTSVSPNYTPTQYRDGMVLEFIPANTNTGSVTVNDNGLGAKNLRLLSGSALSAGDIVAGQPTRIIYNAGAGRFTLLRSGGGNQIVYTAGATYTPDPDVARFTAVCTAGGGGGGGVNGIFGSGYAALAAGGGAGGTVRGEVQAPSGSYTLTVGSGGSGGSPGANNGAAGGNSTISGSGLNVTANGGAGGLAMAGTNGFANSIPGLGGTSSGGTQFTGGDGFWGVVVGGEPANVGNGGASYWGGGGRGLVNGGGSAGRARGAGGGGAGVRGATTNYGGGDGADGIIIIEEFYR